MQKAKRGVKARRIALEKEKISNIAKWLLIAFCLQFVFYLIIINVVPLNSLETGEYNSIYTETWYNYKGSTGDAHTEGNAIGFIHRYNLILLGLISLLTFYYIFVFMDENEGSAFKTIKQFFKENKGLLFLVIFMCFGLIASIAAYDPFRSFIGCYNLRDGYLSFMFYGSILVCMLLMGLGDLKKEGKKLFGKFEIDIRKLIVNLFLIVTTLIAVITIGDYHEINYGETKGAISIKEDGTVEGTGIGISIEPKYYVATTNKEGDRVIETRPRAYNSAYSITSSVFNNSNHYGYLLSIATVVAAAMFIKEKKLLFKLLYGISYIVMTYMLIINDTFGAYLGVTIAILFMLIHGVVVFIKAYADKNVSVELQSTNKKESKLNLIYCVTAVLVIGITSFLTVNTKNENIVKKNFSGIINDTKSIFSSLSDEEKLDTENVGGENNKEEQPNTETEKNEEEKDDAAEAGSGRWKLWVGALDIIKENPIFGVGPENMLYEYNKRGISEGRSHNLLLQLGGTIGIPGTICYFLGIAFIFFKALKNYKTWDVYTYMGMFVIISYMISSLTGNSAFYTSGYFYIFVGFVVLGSFLKVSNESENNISNNNKKNI